MRPVTAASVGVGTPSPSTAIARTICAAGAVSRCDTPVDDGAHTCRRDRRQTSLQVVVELRLVVEIAQQLAHEERVPARDLPDRPAQLEQLRERIGRGGHPDQRAHLVVVEHGQVHAAQLAGRDQRLQTLRDVRADLVVPEGHHDQQSLGLAPAEQVPEQRQHGTVRPVRVLDDQDARSAGVRVDERGDDLVQAQARAVVVDLDARRARAVLVELGQRDAQLRRERRTRLVAAACDDLAHDLGERLVAVALVRAASPDQDVAAEARRARRTPRSASSSRCPHSPRRA